MLGCGQYNSPESKGPKETVGEFERLAAEMGVRLDEGAQRWDFAAGDMKGREGA